MNDFYHQSNITYTPHTTHTAQTITLYECVCTHTDIIHCNLDPSLFTESNEHFSFYYIQSQTHSPNVRDTCAAGVVVQSNGDGTKQAQFSYKNS